jgi:anti-sigma factor ChrR (cupin superfamily)
MLNVDFSQRVVMQTVAMEWQASPSNTVWRKRLDHLGGEFSRVTSVVRYDAGSSFPAHGHPNGEEILVLSGTFSDQSGDYPAGSFLLNPEGFEHAPFSAEGCVIFVKLQQYPGTNRRHVTLNINDAQWRAGEASGVEAITLYDEAGFAEHIELLRLRAGATLPARDAAGGEEILVMEGEVADELGEYPEGTWVRTPPGPRPVLTSAEGATIYRKGGHLPG